MIKIYQKEDEPFKGSWMVETETHIADALCWDEMLGLVATLTLPDNFPKMRYMSPIDNREDNE